METEVWILGATGRSGRAIATELLSRGVAPVLVGRDAARLKEAAATVTSSGRTVVASSVEAMAAEIRRQRPAVVINTIGPFTATAVPLVQACLQGSDYIDLANDVAAVLAVLDLNAAAAAVGRTLVTGSGFGVTASESVVVKLCEGRPAPARVRVDMVPSLEMEAGVIGEALAGTILDGLPGIEGGGRYQGRRYRGWLRVGDAQVYTGAVPAEVARRLLNGEGQPGAYTPAALFGPSLALACGGEYVMEDMADSATDGQR